MAHHTGIITIQTPGRGLREISGEVHRWLAGHACREGLLTLFCRHTSASLTIQENAAPAARRDLEAFFERIAPDGDPRYTHDEEGPDDMPAHIRAALTCVQISIPVIAGQLALGTWQGIFLFEHRLQPHRREIAVHLFGD